MTSGLRQIDVISFYLGRFLFRVFYFLTETFWKERPRAQAARWQAQEAAATTEAAVVAAVVAVVEVGAEAAIEVAIGEAIEEAIREVKARRQKESWR